MVEVEDVQIFSAPGYEKEPIKRNYISWFCDDYPLEEANEFRIYKRRKSYKIKFIKPKNREGFPDWRSVRIRRSGSRYHYLFVPYSEAYMKLQELCEDHEKGYKQINMDEWLVQNNKPKILGKKETITERNKREEVLREL